MKVFDLNVLNKIDIEYKNPVSVINELGTNYKFTDLSKIGSDHEPMFCIALTVDGISNQVADMTFEGWGHSKREARAAAARACLTALLARAGRVLPLSAPPCDFTQDDSKVCPGFEFQCLEAKIKQSNVTKKNNGSVSSTLPQPPKADPPPPCSVFGTLQQPPAQKSPINVLYENYPGLTFHCTYGDGSSLSSSTAPLQVGHSMRFKVVCFIKNQKFEGYGSSKKLAKLAAARAALAVLEEGRQADPQLALTPAGSLPQILADHIGKLVNEKFNELMKGDLVHSKRKVLAGIVITTNNAPEMAKVIAVTTGTKCVSGEHMSVRGRTLNDCHAEVAARRCLQRYLYSQLLLYANSKDPTCTLNDSDLEPVPGGGYQLKSDRQVHLYVSTAPCGDGRIFSPHEDLESEPDRHPNRLARGQLRTKIESGEGTIPVKNCSNVIQTWDGVLQGERLLTMSCSDKVARWCIVGLQGALLSHFLKPVYLHSLVLGSLLHPHHLYRTQFKLDPNSIKTRSDLNSNSIRIRSELNSNSIKTRSDLNSNSIRTRSELNSNSIRTRSKLDPISIQTRSEFDPNSIQTRSELNQNSIRSQFKLDPNSIQTRSKLDPNAIRTRSKLDPNSIQTRSELDQNSIRSQFKLDPNSIKTRFEFDPNSIQTRSDLANQTTFLKISDKD
ncbi:Double-stranded RNA-specific editase Adar [Eumeta japonica]|uniref:Double-stranded RNA-specific editase Adar n=1 Tax=Eumeta variegata TaxID=151549 RepID=A0A4C1WYW2_EUMVA|nr:Double-stranded RNA-specific editase Adar [Eumeta japonica]